jgi:hypothetical protein
MALSAAPSEIPQVLASWWRESASAWPSLKLAAALDKRARSVETSRANRATDAGHCLWRCHVIAVEPLMDRTRSPSSGGRVKGSRVWPFLGGLVVTIAHWASAGAAEAPGGSAVAATPAEVAVSVVAGRRPVRALVSLTSAGGGELRVSLDGEGAAFFRVAPGPSDPLRLRPHEALPLSLEVRAPKGAAQPACACAK